MTERPIIFSAPMVRAILDGRKSQTRRVVKLTYGAISDVCTESRWNSQKAHPSMGVPDFRFLDENGFAFALPPYAKRGNRLWVRETGWERPERTRKMMREGADTWEAFYYDADGISDSATTEFKAWGFKRRPSIHMPRWASRITLEITDVRVERLQEISEADAIAEGIVSRRIGTGDARTGCRDAFGLACDNNAWASSAVQAYGALWGQIHGDGSWDANPWVWRISFRRITP